MGCLIEYTDGDGRVLQVWFSLHHLLPGYWNYFHHNSDVPGGELLQKTRDLSSAILGLKVF